MREVYLYQTVHILDGESLCLREHLAVLDRWSRTLFGCPGPQDAREVGTAIAAVAGWPFVIMAFLSAFPQIQQMPWASTVVAFVITSPLPLWTSITDGSWSFLLGGALLYALRGRRKVQLTVWALVIFLCDFVLTFGMACRQDGFVWTQMFTDYYEWFGVAAVLLMLLYNGQRGSGHKQLFYWFYPAHVYLLYGASCLVYNVLR